MELLNKDFPVSGGDAVERISDHITHGQILCALQGRFQAGGYLYGGLLLVFGAIALSGQEGRSKTGAQPGNEASARPFPG